MKLATVLSRVIQHIDRLDVGERSMLVQLLVTKYGMPGDERRRRDRERKRISAGNSAGKPELFPLEIPLEKASSLEVVSVVDSGSSNSSKQSELLILITSYIDFFDKKHHAKPRITRGKDHKLLNDILHEYGREKTQELLRLFFDSDDEFIAQSGHTLSVFSSVINKLLVGPVATRGRSKVGDRRAVNDPWAGIPSGEIKL